MFISDKRYQWYCVWRTCHRTIKGNTFYLFVLVYAFILFLNYFNFYLFIFLFFYFWFLIFHFLLLLLSIFAFQFNFSLFSYHPYSFLFLYFLPVSCLSLFFFSFTILFLLHCYYTLIYPTSLSLLSSFFLLSLPLSLPSHLISYDTFLMTHFLWHILHTPGRCHKFNEL